MNSEKRQRFLVVERLKKCCNDASAYKQLVDEFNLLIDWFRAHPDNDEPLVRRLIDEDREDRRKIQAAYEPHGEYFGLRELWRIDSRYECTCGFWSNSPRAWVYHRCDSAVDNCISLIYDIHISQNKEGQVMNKQNAKSEGYKDGRLYQSSGPMPQENYELAGNQFSTSSQFYGINLKTTALWLEGWKSAYIAPEPITEPVIEEHNPNTRFCMCPACTSSEVVIQA